MNEQRQETIRVRALSLWEAEGRPFGRDLEHWLEAERTVLAESGTGAVAEPVKPAAKRAKSAKVASAKPAEPTTKAKPKAPAKAAAETPAAKSRRKSTTASDS
jgi:hypothetical protein